MLIWLPPSEGKNAPAQGPSLDVNALSRAGLATSRRTVCDTLVALGDGPEAAAVLKVGARIDLSVNTALDSAPCAPASSVFTGVLYEAIEECAPGAWSSAGAAHVSIFSGLFGVLSPSDVIPDHRLAMGVSLPGLGVLSTWWAPRLDEALSTEASERIIIDGRSGPYRAACKAPWARVWELRVEREADGKRSVISHDAKRWRGAITGLLLASDGFRSEETAAAERALEEAAYSLSLEDAKGNEHRVTDVEYGPEKQTKKGGSTRTETFGFPSAWLTKTPHLCRVPDRPFPAARTHPKHIPRPNLQSSAY